MFKCIKYSYTSGVPTTRKIAVKDNTVLYKGYWKSSYIDAGKIRGIAYGPRTITFNMVKECIPWLVASLITEDRTYDFGFKNLRDLKQFIITMHNINTKYSNNMVIPQLEHIDMDKLWMQHNTASRALKIFQNTKWNDWLNNRNRKYKVINSRDIEANDNGKSCSVCFDKYCNDRLVCQLACGHVFHIDCISQWFQRSFTCPLCRLSIS